MPKFLSDGIFDGSSTDLTVDGSFRSKGDLNYFGIEITDNEAEIVINTGNAGSPQIGFTEHENASWAIGVDDGDNSFKIHGGANDTIPTINNLSSPLIEITTIGQILQRPPSGAGGYLRLGDGVGTQEVALELGVGRTGNGYSYIDLIGDTTYSDYGLRIIRNNGGANTTSQLVHRGTGNFELVSSNSGDIILNPNSGYVGIGITGPTQKLHVAGNLRLENQLYDSTNSQGSAGQILSKVSAGTQWIDQGDVVAGEADKAKSVTIRVKNSTASAMTKGQVVCEAVSATPPSGNLIEVALADNNGTNTMPALGILNEDLDAAGGANDEGDAIMFGKVSGIDTSAFSVGDEVFVDDTPGGLTATKPTGVKYIQKVGVVIRDDASNGTIEVFGAGRVNDVPTPLYVDHANQRLGIGETNPNHSLVVRNGTANTNVKILSFNSAAGTEAALRFSTITSSTNYEKAAIIVRNAAGSWGRSDMHFALDSSADTGNVAFSDTKMTILNNGDVGIGTTDPDSKLHIKEGDITVEGYNTSRYLRFIETDGAFQGGYVNYDGSSNILKIGVHNANDASTSSDQDGIEINRSTGQVDLNHGGAQRLYTASYGVVVKGYLDIRDDSNPLVYFRTGGGTVEGGVGMVDASLLRFAVGSSGLNTDTKMVVKSDGNVGIGTTNPQTGLHLSSATDNRVVGGTDKSILRLANTYAGNFGAGGEIQFGVSDSASGRDVLSLIKGSYTSFANPGYYGGDLEFHTRKADGNGLQQRMTINSNGNVGIGTDDPGHELVVQGTSSPNIELKNSNYSNGGFILNRANYGQQWKWWAESTRMYFGYATNETTYSNKLTIENNGNVGIGTTDPGTTLHVRSGGEALRLDSTSSTGSPYMTFYQNGTKRSFIQHNDSIDTLIIASEYGPIDLKTATNGSESTRVRISAVGNVGINTTNPNQKLTIRGNDNYVATEHTSYVWGGTNTIGVRMGTSTAGLLDFRRWDGGVTHGTAVITQVNSDGGYGLDFRVDNKSTNTAATTSRMFLSTSGEVGIGTTSPGYKLDVSGTIRATGDVIAYSDIRVKENIKTIDNAIDKVKALRGVEYNKIDSTEKSIGVIAQEIEEVIPQVVREDDQGMKSVAYGNITAVLIEAIKEQQKQIDELKTQLDAFTK